MRMLPPALLVALVLATPGPAAAQQPPNGADCRSVLAYVPRAWVWIGTVRGRRAEAAEAVTVHDREACFPSRAACEQWVSGQLGRDPAAGDGDACRPYGRR